MKTETELLIKSRRVVSGRLLRGTVSGLAMLAVFATCKS
jgi:hypothetical protein